MYFTFSEAAKDDIGRLSKKEQTGLKKKLLYWQNSPNPLAQAKTLANHQASHRFRFGVYRVLIKVIDDEIRILKIRHRKDVYK